MIDRYRQHTPKLGSRPASKAGIGTDFSQTIPLQQCTYGCRYWQTEIRLCHLKIPIRTYSIMHRLRSCRNSRRFAIHDQILRKQESQTCNFRRETNQGVVQTVPECRSGPLTSILWENIFWTFGAVLKATGCIEKPTKKYSQTMVPFLGGF